ncbi:MAG: Acylphosphatase [Candidatus Giovannonibacteria bacterium GW2011_GWC2_44_8]|uniref:acylphosphatase n=2 Tax=Candidatus Giovannoniibacteriota TaxID=1752738 RepID=A0A0G1K396_9BACT|nr:MAG: Acylphosphatase [Candidatus Giovannonibacteria bacterium GW2011_GWC2_44_8]
MKHLDIILSGRVQGVGLRYQAKETADKLGLYGCARNLNDGGVFIEAEGNKSSLNQFLEWLKSSPGISKIKESEISESKIKGYREFQIY